MLMTYAMHRMDDNLLLESEHLIACVHVNVISTVLCCRRQCCIDVLLLDTVSDVMAFTAVHAQLCICPRYLLATVESLHVETSAFGLAVVSRCRDLHTNLLLPANVEVKFLTSNPLAIPKNVVVPKLLGILFQSSIQKCLSQCALACHNHHLRGFASLET